MANKELVTLTTDGVITNPDLKLNKLYQYYITSNRSQSTHSKDTVYSLKYVIEKFSGGEDNLTGAIEGDLSEYLTPYFDEVKVTVTLGTDLKNRPIIYVNVKAYTGELVSELSEVVNKDKNIVELLDELYK